MGYYMQSFEKVSRVEPLVLIGEYYVSIRNWPLAYMFVNLACSLEYPHDLILFVDKMSYTYKRLHLMTIIGLNFNKYEQGKAACLKAIEGKPEADFEKLNLNLYEEIEKGNKLEQIKSMTKKQFIYMTIIELQKELPKENLKKLTVIAGLKWKKYKTDK